MLEMPASFRAFHSHREDVNCTYCAARQTCPVGTSNEAIRHAINGITRVRGPYEPGERICRRGKKTSSLALVKHGAVRLDTYTRTGTRIVHGFIFPGELFGGDGIVKGTFPADAFATQETHLCRFSLEELESLSLRIPAVLHWLLELLSNELRTARYQCVALKQLPAAERVLSFLCELAERLGGADKAIHTISLPMRKQDIAAYLGLSSETVSRSLNHLEKRGVIENGKTITLRITTAVRLL